MNPLKIKVTMDFSCVIFVMLSHIAHKVGSRQIHEDLRTAVSTNRVELLQYFDVDSIDSVPEYDITFIRPQPQRTRRDIENNQKNYKLKAFDKDFEFELKPNDNVVSQTLVVMKKLPGNVWTKDLYTPEGRFLQGHVVSDSHSHVAVRELRDAEMTGTFVIEDHMYKLHPINERVKKILSLKGHGHHVITKRSIKDPNSEIFLRAKYPEPVRVLDKENERYDKETHINHRVRRDLGQKYIEAMMTMDKVSCDYYGQVTTDFILAVANMVNRIYKDQSIGINVEWMLTKIILIQAYEAGLDVTKNNVDSAVKYLSVFKNWARNKNTPAGQVEHFDNGVLLSRKICGLKDCALEGVAYSGYLCSLTMGFTVNNARGLDASFFVAHEMAHNFGITHDSGACAKGYMMNSGQAYGPNSFQWSNCSRDLFKSIFRQASCYNNIPPANITLPKLPPGYKFDADRQCKFISGPEYRLCPLTTHRCDLLYCSKVGGCHSLGTSPVDGTPCGNRKWCVGGYCVGVGTSLPPSVDGGWGAWGSYGGCSRTCGGGLRYRTRLCDNPSPMHDGKPCPGSAIGEWKMCNTQDCASNAVPYRTFQCVAKDPSYVGFHLTSSRCYLWCRTIDSRAIGEGDVADGTKYSDEDHVYDICIAGKRVPVGCDRGIRSGKIKDRCMKCQGNGNTCVRIEGTYTKLWDTYGPSNADPMLVIPINTTNFVIKENTNTMNLMNLKLFPPNSTSNLLIFPQRPTNSTRTAAGTTVYYDITNNGLNFAESMFFKGPTTKILVPMFVYINHRNVGYHYNYLTPGWDANTTFIWQAVLSGECSATCAGGLKAQAVTCHRVDDKSRVDEEFCNTSTRPSNNVPCNTQPCAARWEPDPWGPCSSRCGGGGNRTRLVPCLQQVTSSIYRPVESHHCNSSRPNRTESCNEIDCGPAWVVGKWSECFLVNGSQLIAKRFVSCQNKLGNGTIIAANYTDCSDVDSVIPKTTKNCLAIPTTNTLTTNTPTTNTPTTNTPTTNTPTTIRPTTKEISPGDTAENSLAVWLSITLVFIIGFSLVIMVLLIYRAGHMPCQQGSEAIDSMKLQSVPRGDVIA